MTSLSDLMKRANDLEDIEVVESWPDWKKSRYINEVYKHKHICDSSLASVVAKFSNWCDYLKGLDEPPEIIGEDLDALTAATSLSTTFMKTRVTKIPRIFKLRGYYNLVRDEILPATSNTSSLCYDDFNCDTDRHALLGYYILGITALILCIIGIVANCILIPASIAAKARRRQQSISASSIYICIIAVCDLLTLLFAIPLFILHYIWSPLLHVQTQYYTSITAPLFPIGLAIFEMFQLLMLWYVILLQVDRYIYIKHGFNTQAIWGVPMALKCMGFTGLVLLLYCVGKCLRFRVEEIGKDTGQYKVFMTDLYNPPSSIFYNTMMHWLKQPVEMLLPFSLIGGFTCYFSYELAIRNHFSMKQEKKKQAGQLENLTFKVRGHLDSGFRIPVSISNDVELSKEYRENLNVVITLFMSLLLILCRYPRFVIHLLATECPRTTSPQWERFFSFEMGLILLDILCPALKPIITLGVGAHLRWDLCCLITSCFCYCFHQNCCCCCNKNKDANCVSSAEESKMQCKHKNLKKFDDCHKLENLKLYTACETDDDTETGQKLLMISDCETSIQQETEKLEDNTPLKNAIADISIVIPT